MVSYLSDKSIEEVRKTEWDAVHMQLISVCEPCIVCRYRPCDCLLFALARPQKPGETRELNSREDGRIGIWEVYEDDMTEVGHIRRTGSVSVDLLAFGYRV